MHEYYANSIFVNGILIKNDVPHENIVNMFKLFVLLFADDTVILSYSPDDLQNALLLYEQYCASGTYMSTRPKQKLMYLQKESRKVLYM